MALQTLNSRQSVRFAERASSEGYLPCTERCITLTLTYKLSNLLGRLADNSAGPEHELNISTRTGVEETS